MEISDRSVVLRDESPLHLRASTSERIAVSSLPDLTARIDAMGLSHEYKAFRERYQAWRCGSAQGAAGSLQPEEIATRYGGFGYWYPSKEVWSWRRTLSFWIAVTAFEGSMFFSISSFCFCYPEYLGQYAAAMTKHGYMAGKVNYYVCTYLMCVETVNLTATEGDDEVSPHNQRAFPSGVSFFGFEWWPFNVREAVARLQRLGVGPYPYYASIIYFMGVNVFSVGVVAEFLPLSHATSSFVLSLAFTVGSTLFLIGGLAECVENEVFTKFRCKDIGWWGAVLNTIGGAWFVLGSAMSFDTSLSYYANFLFGIGSTVYALGSGIILVMWKDEQFGLTFLSALNKLGGANGRPMILTDGESVCQEVKTFSWRGAGFIVIYIMTATTSTYDGFLSLAEIEESSSLTDILVRPFNCFLPCICTHALLAICSAVVKVPADPPFRELYVFSRLLAVFMLLTSLVYFVETLRGASIAVA